MRKIGVTNADHVRVATANRSIVLVGLACLLTLCVAMPAPAGQIKTVFVIAFENHNWTQPASQHNPGSILGNRNAPYINSLVQHGNPNATQVSYASNYLNAGPAIHPSEANYIWSEAGSNLGVKTDNDPYAPGGNNQSTADSLSNYLQRSGKIWRSYQEDVNIDVTNNLPVAKDHYKVPLRSFAGKFANGTNEYNGSDRYAYGAKHNPPVFFATTNGGNDATSKNPRAQNYAPLQQLQADLANGTVANYNWITPDLYNDMHSPLPAGFTYNGAHLAGDAAQIAQGDNFLSKIVPMIASSQAYKDDGVIIIWWDETEGGDDTSHKIGEMIISPDAKGNAYTNQTRYTHSSDLLTMQKIFNVGPCLRDACRANDLSDLFVPGAIPDQITNNVRELARF